MLGAALLLLVLTVHVGTDAISSAFGLDRAWVFYVARGIEGTVLYGLLLRHSPLVAAVAAWGMLESAMTSICGALAMVMPLKPAPFQGLCDAATGMPAFTYAGLIAAAFLGLSLAIRRNRRAGT